MFSVIKRFWIKNSFSRVSYLADYVSDISNLPTSVSEGTQEDGSSNVNAVCMPGSTCRVAEDSSVWILNNQNKWVEQETSSGGGSGSTGEEATSDEVLALFGWTSEE